MRRHIITATVAVLLAAAPAAAAQARSSADTAKSACQAEKHDMGTRRFKTTYAARSTAKAMAACVAKAEEAAKNAAKACKAQRTDDTGGFEAEWGTKRNAFGKCVSATAQA